jgi:HK97 family phage portal protein
VWPFDLIAKADSPVAAGELRSLENPTKPISSDDFLQWMTGTAGIEIAPVSVDDALQVTAFASGVNFLSRLHAGLPLTLRQKVAGGGYSALDNPLAILLDEAPNPETSSFEWRRLTWQNVFTYGRGLTWIERKGNGDPAALWPMDPRKSRVERIAGRKLYYFEGQREPYPAADVIDLVWMPRADGVGHYSPVQRGQRALALARALDQYATNMFANGGVPAAVVTGPVATGPDATKRMLTDVYKSISEAAAAGRGLTALPPGFTINKVGIDPVDAQLIEGRKMQVVEIARLLNLPPQFLQDLERATFNNAEQQDLQLVKHTVLHWVVAFEQELNLKLFGPRRNARSVKHNLDGIMRGDFRSRVEALARGVQTAMLTPNEARHYLDQPPAADEGANKLHLQGATVPVSNLGNEGAPSAGSDGQ